MGRVFNAEKADIAKLMEAGDTTYVSMRSSTRVTSAASGKTDICSAADVIKSSDARCKSLCRPSLAS